MNGKVDFIIIGAPKCGTTSLATYLSEHKHICFSNPKEPGYFATDIAKKRKYQNINDYLKCFKINNDNMVMGEGSVTNLFSKVAIDNILEHNSCAKFIVALRNPVDMVYSWHSQKCIEQQESILDFEKAWNLQEKRKYNEEIPKYCTIVDWVFRTSS